MTHFYSNMDVLPLWWLKKEEQTPRWTDHDTGKQVITLETDQCLTTPFNLHPL